AEEFTKLWFLDLDLTTGEWNGNLLYTAPEGKRLTGSPKIAISWTGDIWARESAVPEPERVYKVRRKNGNGGWEDWEATDPSYAWYNELFDHNGNPITIETETSDVLANRYKVMYR